MTLTDFAVAALIVAFSAHRAAQWGDRSGQMLLTLAGGVLLAAAFLAARAWL